MSISLEDLMVKASGIPGLGLATSILIASYTTIENIKVYKQQCRDLSGRCVNLINALCDSSFGLEGTKAIERADEITAVVRRVDRKVNEWANLNGLQSFLRQREIKDGINSLHRDIDSAMMRFQIQMHMELARGQVGSRATQERDKEEIRDFLLKIVKTTEDIKILMHMSSSEPRPLETEVMSSGADKKITSITERAVLVNTEPLSKDITHFVEPPRPSNETVNPGYNPQLDKRRPETMVDYLHNYQVLFVIDDSGSMKGDRWMETRDALIGIADYALKYNTDHVNIRFLNSQQTFPQIKGASTIMSIFDMIQPRGYTPTGAILDRILREHISKLDDAINTKEYELIRPLDIIVLTDGIPSDQPKLVLTEAVKKMRVSKHHPKYIGVQFVQIANDDGADIALRDLVCGENGGMVDSIPFDGELTAERLERILLGGLHPTSLLNTDILSKDIAHFVEPPRPSNETVNPGYNPQLDKRRPETMVDYLHNYQVLFVIDDSGSMKGDRWRETRDALIRIADYALKYNTDHVNIRFLNSQQTFPQIKGASTIMSIFDMIQPRGYTPTGAILDRILREHISKLDDAINTKEYELIQPLDIIVLTDGIPSDQPKLVLAEAVKKMQASKHHPNCIGIQFVQIANDDGADIALRDLVYGENGSMVDTVPFDGELTAERLERILLGGLHPNVRALIPIRW